MVAGEFTGMDRGTEEMVNPVYCIFTPSLQSGGRRVRRQPHAAVRADGKVLTLRLHRHQVAPRPGRPRCSKPPTLRDYLLRSSPAAATGYRHCAASSADTPRRPAAARPLFSENVKSSLVYWQYSGPAQLSASRASPWAQAVGPPTVSSSIATITARAVDPVRHQIIWAQYH